MWKMNWKGSDWKDKDHSEASCSKLDKRYSKTVTMKTEKTVDFRSTKISRTLWGM